MAALAPLRWWYVRRYYRVTELEIQGLDQIRQRVGPEDGLLLAPNHCHPADPQVMMKVVQQAGKDSYFMATQEAFRLHRGLDGWILQRHGVFSVDRESMDRQAIRQAVELLTTGQVLVVFPEGEIYRLNDRLSPLLDGVAFMALSAQRELEKTPGEKRVWIVPTFIRYSLLDDIRQRLEADVSKLEKRFFLQSQPTAPLHERIIRLGEVALTIKEKEKLGASGEKEGDLAARLTRLRNNLLEKWEKTYLKKAETTTSVPLRVKALRRNLLELLADDNTDAAASTQIHEALDDLHLVLQVLAYRGDYLAEKPSMERMAETVEKFEEDLYGSLPFAKGRRRAKVVLGEPMDLKAAISSGRPRTQAAELTSRLESTLQQLLTNTANGS
jgi:1-acyl-sn-glycerol-3-phosphate acyltransferase